MKEIRRQFKEANRGEISTAIRDNLIFGFSGAVIVPFIAERIDIAVLICYLFHFFFISKVINRPKYVTSLAKFILFPIPTALGAFMGYKLAYLMSQYMYVS